MKRSHQVLCVLLLATLVAVSSAMPTQLTIGADGSVQAVEGGVAAPRKLLFLLWPHKYYWYGGKYKVEKKEKEDDDDKDDDGDDDGDDG